MATSMAGTTRFLLALLMSLLLLGGCQTFGNGSDTSACRGVSTGIGALIGGLLGAQVGGGSGRTAAAVVGTGLGAYIGHEIGARFTCEDRQAMGEALDRTVDGESESWRNPRNGNEFTVTPQQTFQRGDQQCRAYEMEVVVDGEPRRADGTACRRPDEQSWTTV